jgi:hypothetical protein
MLPLVFAMLGAFATIADAQTTRLTLLEEISSKLPTGSPFSAKDSSGRLYKGYVVGHPARRLLRRGWLMLVFNDPVVPVTGDREGAFRAGNKMRLLKLGGYQTESFNPESETYWYSPGIPEVLIQRVLRHKPGSPVTRQHHIKPNESEMRNAMETFGKSVVRSPLVPQLSNQPTLIN